MGREMRAHSVRSLVPIVFGALGFGISPPGFVQSADAEDEIIVTAVADRQLLLDAKPETGSRLGLSVRETPAIVDILSERQMREFGARYQFKLGRSPANVTRPYAERDRHLCLERGRQQQPRPDGQAPFQRLPRGDF